MAIPEPSDAPNQLAVLSNPPLIEHVRKSAKDDGIDSTLVQPSDWNLPHKISMPASSVLGRDNTGAGPAQAMTLDTAPGDALHVPTTDYVTKSINDAVAAAMAGLGVAVTGDISASMLSTKTGWILLNGQTIGNAGSGADYANADARDLFIAFWGGVTGNSWPVMPSRGADAVSDWNANKTIKMPDGRGRVLGMIDHGAGVNSILTLLGAGVGEEKHQLTANENGPHAHPTGPGTTTYSGNSNVGGLFGYMANNNTGITGNSGAGDGHNTVQPTLGVNFFIKL
jgi:microcystin-dependent protein